MTAYETLRGGFRRVKSALSAGAMVFALLFALCASAILSAVPADAANRTLDLYFTHTKERLKVVYKRNGAYVPSALRDLNRFLRDWRRNEATKMDPELFDLIWEVQQEFGGKTIHVVSAYRSPATNSMLRKRSRGVAKNSHHMAGKAIDFFIKGANISKVRQEGIKRQVGGVGYYPRSRSPFVHMDTGRVRAWPRMNRKQLVRLFPNGKTMHIPSDGKPLKGYKEAQALEKAGKLQTLRGGSSLGVRSLFAFGGGGTARGASRDDPGGIVRPASTNATAVAAADPPPSRVRTTRAPATAEREPKREERRREVQTASLGPATSTSRSEDGERQGIFRQLPSVSLGGLIDRFSGDEENAASVATVSRPSEPLTAVTATAPARDPIADVQATAQARDILSETAGSSPPIPQAAPRRRPDSPGRVDELLTNPDAADAAGVAVAALPPDSTTGVVSDASAGPALGYARADRVDENGSPLSATAALLPASASASATVDRAASTGLFAPSATASRQPVLKTEFAPVRGASPALIANHGDLEGGGWDMDAPDRFGASAQGVLLVNGFLGAPRAIGDSTNWPSIDGFTGLKITVYARPRSGT